MCRAFAPPSGDERFPWSAWEPTLASGLTPRMRRGTYYQRPVDGPSFGEVDADVGFPPERTARRCSAGRMTAAQQAEAHLFRSLQTVAGPLALANAWDVASARVIESAGAPAIATTSAGVAAAGTRWRNPAMLTPGSRADGRGTATSTAAQSKPPRGCCPCTDFPAREGEGSTPVRAAAGEVNFFWISA
ncbi:hypothetical protein SSPO_080320 [Streptomyces antimycoticus]|uniref:Uncharacterized protein n=1 Tax=Streptomyces antimycoticus TaxID=68175 RepID=A0A499UTQ9_9ACTN|nr:hypothetical protein SSPO_080320 [Streptomyces antimycoticus]